MNTPSRQRYTILGYRAVQRLLTGGRRLCFDCLEDRSLLTVFTVVNNLDTGAGSLRDAIESSNLSPGADAIVFNISGTGVHTIQPLTSLPEITDAVTIDGYTQPGASGNTLAQGNNATLQIEIDGSQLGMDAIGLLVSAEGTHIRGLIINQFASSGQAPFAGTAIFIHRSNVVVEGNFLGTDSTGAMAKPNGHGIVILDPASGVRIGTNGDSVDDFLERNVISGNSLYGVFSQGFGNHQVSGNYIGTNASGTGALDNGNAEGIVLYDSQCVIGTDGIGNVAAEGNLISGNPRGGVHILFGVNNVVAGNFIGTDAAGLSSIPNGRWGVANEYSSPGHNTIGTNGDGLGDAAERNLIAGNTDTGILISNATDNVIAGNYIGVDDTGANALPNITGVFFQYYTHNNRIGTNADGIGDDLERNVIGANLYDNVRIDGGDENTIAGNYIGTNAAGDAALSSSSLRFHGATRNVVGTNGDGDRDEVERNVIVGQAVLHADSHANVVAGNSFGTDATGTIPLSSNGLLVYSDSNRIGTNGDGVADAAERNVVNGGVQIYGGHDNIVAGNYLGTDVSGSNSLGGAIGLLIGDGGWGNRIGTDGDGQNDEAERNVISGNVGAADRTAGVILMSGAHDNNVWGNYIGTNVAGDVVPNLQGVLIDSTAAENNDIGGLGPLGNIIAHNTPYWGIGSYAGSGNTISGNRIYDNAILGIDLYGDGVTDNDNGSGDADSGPNGLQNFPVITSVVTDGTATEGGNATINGTLDSTIGGTFILEFFANAELDPSGHGEGEKFLGSGSVTDDDNDGMIAFAVSVSGDGTLLGDYVTATATDAQGNTSEFSLGVAAVADAPEVDADGVGSSVENNAPHGGDGNMDSIVDAQQDDVASIPNAVNSDYITLVSSTEGTSLAHVAAISDIPENGPAAFIPNQGLITFTVNGPTGFTSVVELFFEDPSVTEYYKYGRTPEDQTNHWYKFDYDGLTGAQFLSPGHVKLTFVDGQRGDDDLSVNGVIKDDGALGLPNALPNVHDDSFSVSTLAGNGAVVGHVQANDPDVGQTLSFEIVAGNASGAFAIDPSSGVVTVADRTQLALKPDFLLTVFVLTVRVTDDGEIPLFDDGQIAITLTEGTNVAPTAALAGSAAGVRGQTQVFLVSASDDPGDLAIGLTYQISWGDGSPEETIPATPGNGAGVEVAHVFADSGLYTVSVTAEDPHHVVSAPATGNISVTAIGVQPDPLHPGQSVLVIGGTNAADTIDVARQNASGGLVVTLNSQNLGSYSAAGRIIVYGQDGNDTISISGAVSQDAWLYGNEGDDQLKGGAGHDLLLGGAGNDLLVGGQGRDFLIGGMGADRIVGNADDDMLVAASTHYDSRDLVLNMLISEWTSTETYAVRTAHLAGSAGGLNGGYFLIGEGPSATVHDDNAKDTLTGSAGQDWFFANLFLDNGDDANHKDKITDLSASEFANDLDFILT